MDEWLAALTSASALLAIKDLEITIIDSEGGKACQKELTSLIYKRMRNLAPLTDEILRDSSLKIDVIPIYLSWTSSLPAELDQDVEDFRAYNLVDAEDDITAAFWGLPLSLKAGLQAYQISTSHMNGSASHAQVRLKTGIRLRVIGTPQIAWHYLGVTKLRNLSCEALGLRYRHDQFTSASCDHWPVTF